MKKNKIYDKISALQHEVEQMETEIKKLVNDPINSSYPKVSQLCTGINVILNQVALLEDLVC